MFKTILKKMQLKFKTIIEKFSNKTKFQVSNLNLILLILSFILFASCIYITNNIYFIILLYIYLFFLYKSSSITKVTLFLTNISLIMIIGWFLLQFLILDFLPFDILKYLRILIKVLLLLDYFLIIAKEIKGKNIKYVKGGHIKRTFFELRKRNIKKFYKKNKDLVNDYVELNDVDNESDYYKVLKDNLEYKTKNDLEEYVWLQYLRFYKNKKYIRKIIWHF